MKNNKALELLFEEDLRDRENGAAKYTKQLDILKDRDFQRIKKVKALIRANTLRTAEDFYRAAIIFQHGYAREHLIEAKRLAKKSFRMGSSDGAWLYASAVDRLRLFTNKKQKFGTNFYQKNGRWRLYPVEEATTDAERIRYNVMPIAQIKKMVNSWNRRGLNPWEDKKRPGLGLTKLRR